MKNIKKMITVMSIAGALLIGCSNNNDNNVTDLDNNDTPGQNTTIDKPVENVEKDVDSIKLTGENIYFTSNLRIDRSYYVDGSQYDHSKYEHIIPNDERAAMLENAEVMFEESISLVSSHLSDKPFQYSDSIALDSLHTPMQLGSNHVLTNILSAETTRLILINKSIDDHMNQVQPIENYTNVLEHIDEVIAHPFDTYDMDANGQVALIELYSAGDYTLYLAPSSNIMSSADSIDSKLKLFNEYAEYFKTDDVQAIFAKYLNQ